MIRLYPENTKDFEGLLNNLHESMLKQLEQAAVCKRLINPADCNPKCITGYDFIVKDKRFQKCRYTCFQFAVNEESKNVLTEWIKKITGEQ